MKTPHQINIPEKCLLLLIGASASGKSTFAKAHFKATEIVSSDFCRAAVADSDQVLDANEATFELLHLIARKRLQRGLLTVIDATNLDQEGRQALVQLAREHHLPTYAIALNPPLETLKAHNAARTDRQLPEQILLRHHRRVNQSLRYLRREGIQRVVQLTSPDTYENKLSIVRKLMPSNRQHDQGPFDIIGDVHGCFEELVTLLKKLDYQIEYATANTEHPHYGFQTNHPQGRKAVFVGDLVDRGPASNKVLRLVMSMVAQAQALCVPGNHDDKLRRYLLGKQVKIAHGLAETIAQLASEPAAFQQEVLTFLQNLPHHLELDGGKLLVAHAGLKASMHGRVGRAVESFCLYGETTGEVDELGLPVRYPWAQDYHGDTMIVYGHTPVAKPQWFNRTMCLDTGCVFGHELTALRYPEQELVTTPALATYAETKRPITEVKPIQHDVLDAADVLGRQTISTHLRGNILLTPPQTLQALETMSRFAADPRQLFYLPPTMSPPATSSKEGFLEHPAEAFAYYREQGVTEVVCEEKHMGSRAVVVIGESEESLREKFGVNKGLGWILTRTGRPFFNDTGTEQALLERLSRQLTKSGFWKKHATQWVLLDAELMPWSAKAMGLLEKQYAATAAAGNMALQYANQAVAQAQARGVVVDDLQQRMQQRAKNVALFQKAYQPYCWPVNGVENLRLAPFHLLATEGQTYVDKDHHWHLTELATCCGQDEPTLQMTRYRWVNLHDEQAVQAATDWWLSLTENGGEGIVVKPRNFITQQEGKLVQPALKVRGREYLRLIYGPDYTLPENLARLRQRALGKKRSLAEREFALGVEALQRFTNNEALTKVHQCVFAILALESELVDGSL